MAGWRQGHKVPNHVYLQGGDEPSDDDRWVGSFPKSEDAALAVIAVNAILVVANAGPWPKRPDDA